MLELNRIVDRSGFTLGLWLLFVNCTIAQFTLIIIGDGCFSLHDSFFWGRELGHHCFHVKYVCRIARWRGSSPMLSHVEDPFIVLSREAQYGVLVQEVKHDP